MDGTFWALFYNLVFLWLGYKGCSINYFQGLLFFIDLDASPFLVL